MADTVGDHKSFKLVWTEIRATKIVVIVKRDLDIDLEDIPVTTRSDGKWRQPILRKSSRTQ